MQISENSQSRQIMSIPKPEFPRPEKQRENWFNLNGEWNFRLFPEGNEDEEKSFSKERAEYSEHIVVPFTWTCPLSGVQNDAAGIGWYQRYVNFHVNGRVFICFVAVDYLCDVYINGMHVGQHQGGYSYFEFDVTDLWNDGQNLIEVRAEDYRRDTQLYGKQGYGEIQGIWQTLWLEERPADYIRDFKTETKICGDITISVSAEAPDGSMIIADFDGYRADAFVKDKEAVIRLHIDEPELWSTEDPHLYEGTLTLVSGEQKDRVHTYFGIREIGTGTFGERDFKWITLNGKPVFLNGTMERIRSV